MAFLCLGLKTRMRLFHPSLNHINEIVLFFLRDGEENCE